MIGLILAFVPIYKIHIIYIYRYRIFYNSMTSVSLRYCSKPERKRDRKEKRKREREIETESMNGVEGRREKENKVLDLNRKQLFSTCTLTNIL